MRSDLNEFLTKYMAIVGAAVMLVGFVAFVVTAYDENRVDNQYSALQNTSTPSSNSGS
ncbi:hypothetical protein [Rhodoferax sp. U11-2br]|uniref:hypothetical protein n=1 Tax=Rhodoferax sp. U11-2br TaxID=2838878 RepID=UPI001BE4EA3B|nr:hypothetical protein [Rhodoferax sp. U11-2br]MBT3068230.1 hypothetical protein [Rhodoferax sp. U11-2br]